MRWKSEWTTPTVVGICSFGIGVAVGYGIRSYKDRRFVRSFDQIVKEVKDNVDQLELELEPEPTVVRLPDIEHAIEQSRMNHPASNDPFVAKMEREILFSEIQEDWDYDEEMKTRTPDRPYIIHRDEFDDDERGYGHTTLTYYRGDNILCDEDDTPIYNHEKVVSPLTFGKGSGDPSIVYIRNEKLEAEYEVILDTGYYQREVLGTEFEEKFEHTKNVIYKFRQD